MRNCYIAFDRNLEIKFYMFWTIGSIPRFMHWLLLLQLWQAPLLLQRRRHHQIWQGAYGLGFRVRGVGRGGFSRGLKERSWTVEDRRWVVDMGGRRGAGGDAKAAGWQQGEGWRCRRGKTGCNLGEEKGEGEEADRLGGEAGWRHGDCVGGRGVLALGHMWKRRRQRRED